ncbi:MAG: hypothetical protein K1X75_16215 [Leptospirales bacterium]|nr:hypothetical protein [Leptospirales bacterium]
MKRLAFWCGILGLFSSVALGCVTNVSSTRMQGITSAERGRPAAFQNTTTYAIHLFFGVIRLFGDGKTGAGVENFLEEARQSGMSRVEITNVNTNILWYPLGPITMIFTPVVTDAYGFVYR